MIRRYGNGKLYDDGSASNAGDLKFPLLVAILLATFVAMPIVIALSLFR